MFSSYTTFLITWLLEHIFEMLLIIFSGPLNKQFITGVVSEKSRKSDTTILSHFTSLKNKFGG